MKFIDYLNEVRIEKSKELLEKLRRTNYKRIPDFGMDEESEMIIKVIINECKSTLAFQDQDGEVTFERYGSDIIKENIEQQYNINYYGVSLQPKTTQNKKFCDLFLLAKMI